MPEPGRSRVRCGLWTAPDLRVGHGPVWGAEPAGISTACRSVSQHGFVGSMRRNARGPRGFRPSVDRRWFAQGWFGGLPAGLGLGSGTPRAARRVSARWARWAAFSSERFVQGAAVRTDVVLYDVRHAPFFGRMPYRVSGDRGAVALSVRFAGRYGVLAPLCRRVRTGFYSLRWEAAFRQPSAVRRRLAGRLGAAVRNSVLPRMGGDPKQAACRLFHWGSIRQQGSASRCFARVTETPDRLISGLHRAGDRKVSATRRARIPDRGNPVRARPGAKRRKRPGSRAIARTGPCRGLRRINGSLRRWARRLSLATLRGRAAVAAGRNGLSDGGTGRSDSHRQTVPISAPPSASFRFAHFGLVPAPSRTFQDTFGRASLAGSASARRLWTCIDHACTDSQERARLTTLQAVQSPQIRRPKAKTASSSFQQASALAI